MFILRPPVGEANPCQIFWRTTWTSFSSSWCSFWSSEEADIGDTGAGDNPDWYLPGFVEPSQRLRNDAIELMAGIHGVSGHTTRAAIILECECSRMNIFTIIGVVVVVILVAGYLGIHGVSF